MKTTNLSVDENLQLNLENKGKLLARITARTYGSRIENLIVGFIPYPSNEPIFFPEMTNFHIGPDRIALNFIKSPQKEITQRTVKIATEIRKIESILKVEKDILLNWQYEEIRKYLDNRTLNNAQKLKMRKELSEQFYFENDSLMYKPSEQDYGFYSHGNLYAVTSNFLCLCRFISPITGRVEFSLELPQYLIETLPDA